MDAPNLAAPAHERALDALARINRLSLTALRVWREVRRRGVGLDRPLRVLDVACGGGDVALALKARALHAGLEVDVAGCDVSATAVEYARRRAGARALDVTFFQLDALADPIPPGYDLVCSSLFLHHLPEEDAVAFLANLSRAAPSVLLQDLLRTRLGYLLAWITVRTVTRSRIVRVDGIRSVESAYALDEVEGLVRRAGMAGARLRRCWPQRFSLIWDAP